MKDYETKIYEILLDLSKNHPNKYIKNKSRSGNTWGFTFPLKDNEGGNIYFSLVKYFNSISITNKYDFRELTDAETESVYFALLKEYRILKIKKIKEM